MSFKKYQQKFGAGEIPLPDFWGGLKVNPHYMEFWQGRSSRLHDRICFEKQQEQWKMIKLHP